MQSLAHRLIFLTKKNLAQRMSVRGEHATGANRHWQQMRAGKSSRCDLMIGTTEEAHHPGFRSSKYLSLIRPHNHLTRWIERADSRKHLFCALRLVRNKIYRKSSRLLVDPFMERATHAATSVIEDFNARCLFRCFHDKPFGCFQYLLKVQDAQEENRKVFTFAKNTVFSASLVFEMAACNDEVQSSSRIRRDNKIGFSLATFLGLARISA